MNSTEILKTITGVLDTLSKKLGVAADKIYPVLLQQVQVNLVQDIVSIIFSIIIIFATIIIGKIIYAKFNPKDSYEDADIANFFIYSIGIIICIISVVTICYDVNQIIQIVLNPNYFIFDQYIQPLIKK